MPNPNQQRSKRFTRKGSIIKFSILGAIVLIVGLLSVLSFNVPFLSNGIYRFNSFASQIKLGIDLKGGVYALYEAKEDNGADLEQRMSGTSTRLQSLLSSKGYTEATVVREGTNRIRVEVPDVSDPQAVLKIIGSPAELVIKADTEDAPDTIVGSKHIQSATVTTVAGGGYGVNLKLNSEGSKLFQQLTTDNIGKQVQIITRVEGEDDQVTKVNVNSTISDGVATISGNMPQRQDAQKLADQIASGSFAVKLSLLNTDVVSATLGERALTLAVIAGLIGIIIVMGYMLFMYRFMGLIACFGLILFLVLIAFLLYFVPWVQLTLPGVAGVIMTIGMTVDANVIIYERIKDEYRSGRSFNASVNTGFSRALIGLIDANITTVIAAISLMIFGIGSIQGFGIVLLIGVLTTMFSAVFMSQKMLRWLVAITGEDPKKYGLKRPEGTVEISDEPEETNNSNNQKGGLVFDGI